MQNQSCHSKNNLSQVNSDSQIENRVEVSVVMPCLNEEKTIGICIQKAKAALKEMDVLGEIIVADNRSTDKSVEIAKSLGAKVVHQPIHGYGAAYLAGIASAQGKQIVIGDSDDTYDFSELGRFIQPLKEGSDPPFFPPASGGIKGGLSFLWRDSSRSDAMATQIHRQSCSDWYSEYPVQSKCYRCSLRHASF